MLNRLFIASVTLFFVSMNVLLWRREIAGTNNLGSPVSVRMVWEKVLTAPDFSPLEIRHHGEKIGYCRWIPSIEEDRSAARARSGDLPPEGMVRRPLNYVIDLNGVILLDEVQRLRFSFDLKLSTNHTWQEFSGRVGLRPSEWSVRSVAGERQLQVVIEEDGAKSERVFTYDDLRNPDKLLREFGGPLLPVTLGALGLSVPSTTTIQTLSLGLKWEAHQDRLSVGNATIRGYRLRARLFDRYEIVLFVSSVGEILRVELPDQVLLRNDALNSLYAVHD
ncbi:MAG: hypothetical protein L0Y58_17165 [Verrucomicrobia subdivision 3 bacterium]|nr:hypothetical protein [Limisphaerales bacterium]